MEETEIYITRGGAVDHHRYNQPTGEGQQEVAGFTPGSEEDGVDRRREIRLRARGNPNETYYFISDAHMYYDALHFVLLHPMAQHGWEYGGIPLLPPPVNHRQQRGRTSSTDPNGSFVVDEAAEHGDYDSDADEDGAEIFLDSHAGTESWTRGRQKYVSKQVMLHTAYFMHDRNPSNHSYFVRGKKLYQEWLVEQFAKVESRRLQFLQQNQKLFRSDHFAGLADSMAAGDTNNLSDLGQRVLLPSSHVGSPRFLHQLYQDAMGIVRALGRPDYFITLTCNTKWTEITEALKPGEVPNDRPDIISRVFRMKLNALMKFLTKDKILGVVIGHIHVIEFQKRGLPHAHILLIMREERRRRQTKDNQGLRQSFMCRDSRSNNTSMIMESSY